MPAMESFSQKFSTVYFSIVFFPISYRMLCRPRFLSHVRIFSRFLSRATIRNSVHYVTRFTAPIFCHVHLHILSQILNVQNSCKNCIGNAQLQVNWPTGMPDTCGDPQCMKPHHPASTGDKLRHKLKLCTKFHS